MSFRSKSFALLLFVCTFAIAEASPYQVGGTAPNIVVILADDLGQGDLGCYNSESKIPTPHLDALANAGMRFTDAHSPSAVCTPTRYGVLTGRYCWRTSLKSGVLWGRSANLIDVERVTLADALTSGGYRSFGVGKWHLGLGGEQTDYGGTLNPSPVDHGFETFFGIPASLDMAPYLYILDDRAVQGPTGKVQGSSSRRGGGGGFWRAGSMSPDFRHIEVLPRFTQKAEQWIERAARDNRANEKQRPFFMYLALSAPHTPWLPTEPFRGSSQAGVYGDFVVQVDAHIGQLMATLERLGLAENTIVVVTSDNGSHWTSKDQERWKHKANVNWRGQKADIHEGGHRVPLLVRWPGHVPKNSTCDELTVLTDLMPSLCSLAGVPLWSEEDQLQSVAEDGFDLSWAWLGQSGPVQQPDAKLSLRRERRTSAVHHSLDGLFAIRRGPWKLIEGLGSGGFTNPKREEPDPNDPHAARGQLYNIEDDPSESHNLWTERPEVVKELSHLLEQTRQQDFSR